MATKPTTISPQPGPQTAFLASAADIAIFGGAAGGGKTYGLLLEPIRHAANKDFGAVVFRRNSTQITGEGGLWDTARQLYPLLNAEPRFAPRMMFRFPSGAKVSFSHLQYENDVLSWQGSQIPLIMFDELTHFTREQFFYMLSRNRSTCGVRPYVRATCNPDVDSWVAEFISWWIDQETGLPIPARSGVLRYFTRIGDKIIWADTPDECAQMAGLPPADAQSMVKSVTFIASRLEDNAILMERDPSYRANLLALPRVERERLLGGNWKVRRAAGGVFPRDKVEIVSAVPPGVLAWVRRWDLAASSPTESSPDPDSTSGVLMGIMEDGRVVVADRINVKQSAADVRALLLRTAKSDRTRYRNVRIIVPQDPGQAGKDQAASLVRHLRGFPVQAVRETGSKESRADPFAAQWQVGNVMLVHGSWNDEFITELEGFPDGAHDDDVDAASGAYNFLTTNRSSIERFKALA